MCFGVALVALEGGLKEREGFFSWTLKLSPGWFLPSAHPTCTYFKKGATHIHTQKKKTLKVTCSPSELCTRLWLLKAAFYCGSAVSTAITVTKLRLALPPEPDRPRSWTPKGHCMVTQETALMPRPL